MKDPVDSVVRAIARRNAFGLVVAQFGLAHVVTAAGLGLLTLYQPVDSEDFLLLMGVLQALVLVDNAVSFRIVREMWGPVRRWTLGASDPDSIRGAWVALATL